jgi:hypothetical protein
MQMNHTFHDYYFHKVILHIFGWNSLCYGNQCCNFGLKLWSNEGKKHLLSQVNLSNTIKLTFDTIEINKATQVKIHTKFIIHRMRDFVTFI